MIARMRILLVSQMYPSAAAPDFGVFVHFLFPTGFGALVAARAARAPLVVTAHGQDVANATEYPFVRPFLRRVVRGSAWVIAVSDWLRARLEQSVPEARGKTEVVDCGVDLDRFRPLERTGAAGAALFLVCPLIARQE